MEAPEAPPLSGMNRSIKRIPCSFCGKWLWGKSELLRHLSDRRDCYRVKSDVMNKSVLKIGETHWCDVCGVLCEGTDNTYWDHAESFYHVDRLKFLESKISEYKIETCVKCEESFFGKADLEAHLVEKKSETEDTLHKDVDTSRFGVFTFCKICNQNVYTEAYSEHVKNDEHKKNIERLVRKWNMEGFPLIFGSMEEVPNEEEERRSTTTENLSSLDLLRLIMEGKSPPRKRHTTSQKEEEEKEKEESEGEEEGKNNNNNNNRVIKERYEKIVSRYREKNIQLLRRLEHQSKELEMMKQENAKMSDQMDQLEAKMKESDERFRKLESGETFFQGYKMNEIAKIVSGLEDESILQEMKNKNIDKMQTLTRMFEKANENITKTECGLNQNLCPICFENKCDVVLNDCGHLICSNCSEKIEDTCPFCRKDVRSKIRIYKN